MHHPTESQIEALHNATLDDAQAAEIRAHIDQCPDCAARLDSLRRVDDLVRAAATSTPDADYWKTLPDRVRSLSAQPSRTNISPNRVAGIAFWAIVEMAAALIIVCIASLLISFGNMNQQSAAKFQAAQIEDIGESPVATTQRTNINDLMN